MNILHVFRVNFVSLCRFLGGIVYCLSTLVMGLHEKTTIVFLFLTGLFLSSFSPLWQSLFALCLA